MDRIAGFLEGTDHPSHWCRNNESDWILVTVYPTSEQVHLRFRRLCLSLIRSKRLKHCSHSSSGVVSSIVPPPVAPFFSAPLPLLISLSISVSLPPFSSPPLTLSFPLFSFLPPSFSRLPCLLAPSFHFFPHSTSFFYFLPSLTHFFTAFLLIHLWFVLLFIPLDLENSL